MPNLQEIESHLRSAQRKLDEAIKLGAGMTFSCIDEHSKTDCYCRNCDTNSDGKPADDPSWHEEECCVAEMVKLVLEKRERT